MTKAVRHICQCYQTLIRPQGQISQILLSLPSLLQNCFVDIADDDFDVDVDVYVHVVYADDDGDVDVNVDIDCMKRETA